MGRNERSLKAWRRTLSTKAILPILKANNDMVSVCILLLNLLILIIQQNMLLMLRILTVTQMNTVLFVLSQNSW